MSEGIPLILNDGTNSYIYGPSGLPVEQVSTGGTVLYLHHDQQGSTRMLTGSTGKSEATMTYDPYGNTTGTTGTATTSLGYGGQYTSTDTGLIYLRARTYDPKTAQFLTTDPLNSQTHQPYAYAGDNPLSTDDHTGMCGAGSVGEALESINPFSEENCAYQGTKALVEAVGERHDDSDCDWSSGGSSCPHASRPTGRRAGGGLKVQHQSMLRAKRLQKVTL